MKSLKFGVDFDDTITADKNAFGKIFKVLQNEGHEVVVVTGRSAIDHWKLEAEKTIKDLCFIYDLNPIEIVFAGPYWKKEAAKEQGHEIDIWIDNSPEYIGKQWLLKDFEISPDNLFSPETSGRVRRELEEALKVAWLNKMNELKIYPKRVNDPEVKDKLWSRIDNEAQVFIQKLLKELSEIE
jgi:hydroxymethylpyrimidine pyrophosphatase-like HAD family hydrolase